MIGYLVASWKDNKETLGDERHPSTSVAFKTYAIMLAIAFTLAFSAGEPSTDTLSGVLTAFAIVAGFTFSALLFFVDHRFVVTVDKDSREQQALQTKIDSLSDQLFININYFNLVCVALVVCSVLALIRPPLVFFLGRDLSSNDQIAYSLGLVFATAFYALVSEAVFTFLRLLSRLRYLFDKVRTAQKKVRT